nr:MAG TPA: baseplate protein [Caudoviricetes sp.]
MAATTIKTSTVYDSYFWVKWESGGQDVSANKTAINWSCGVTPGHKFYSNAVKMSAVSIGGVKVYAGGTYSNITDYKEHTFASGTLEVSHNADGSKTLTVSAFSGQVWKDSGYLTATAAAQSFQLAAIPRATEPVMGAATMGEAVRISLPRASSAFTHTLSYVFGAASGTIAENAGTEVQWTVPESLAAQIPDSSVGTGTLTCRTYNGGTLVGTKTVTFTATVPQSMKPALTNGWATVSYDNSDTKASGIAAWVQGYSKAKAVFDSSKIACKQGASIAKYAVTYLGKTVEESPYRTETISTTSATVRCTVTDSRGLTAWEDVTVELESYAPPMLVGAALYRADGEGAAADSGTHIAGLATAKFSSIGGRNTATIKGYWKSVGGSYGEGVTLPFGAVGLVTGDVEIAGDRSYTAKIVVTDSLGNSTEFEENIPTEQVAFHLKEGGKGAAFGKAAEQDELLDVAWDARFREDVQVDGALRVGGKTLLDMVYPVGSIYLSVSETDPQTLFGGTWARLEDVFLLAAGAEHAAGSTGGEESHILTEAEIAPHKHAMAYSPDASAAATGFSYGIAAGNATNSAGGRGYESNLGTFSAGGGQPHNNMPPYLAVYTWKRTA